ncbi:MAG: hypothetical protein HYU66_09560 [Armatimonadetes bacterium]|nr:hypothetical protein [Armatimonadota bacterium]
MAPRRSDDHLDPEPQVADVWIAAGASAATGLLFMLFMSVAKGFAPLAMFAMVAVIAGAAGAATHGLLRWLAGKLGFRSANRSQVAWIGILGFVALVPALAGLRGADATSVVLMLLSVLLGGALGYRLLAGNQRRAALAATATAEPASVPATHADLDALRATAREDLARLRELAADRAGGELADDLRSLAASAETALAEVERLIPRLVLLRQVTTAHPRDERARAREQRAFDRLMALGQAIEEAAETAAAYAAGQPVAARLTGEVRQMERLVESYGELERELSADE